jgi:uncharacterized protein (DUF1697 family)
MSPAPARLIAFLRAINVGGHTVEMARLRKLFEKLGLEQVETFIASGNVIFAAPKGPPAALEKRIAAHLEQSLGYEVMTFLRTPAELADALAYRAFKSDIPGATSYIGFLAVESSAAVKKQVAALATDIDDLHVHGRELYWRCRGRFSDSVVSGKKLEKALGQPTTIRNVTTVGKLAKKFG